MPKAKAFVESRVAVDERTPAFGLFSICGNCKHFEGDVRNLNGDIIEKGRGCLKCDNVTDPFREACGDFTRRR